MKMSWGDQLMKMFIRSSQRNFKKKIKEKAQILFGRSQSQWKNSRINDKVFREVFQSQLRVEVYMKNIFSFPTPMRRQDSTKENFHLAWSKHVSSQGVFLWYYYQLINITLDN